MSCSRLNSDFTSCSLLLLSSFMWLYHNKSRGWISEFRCSKGIGFAWMTGEVSWREKCIQVVFSMVWQRWKGLMQHRPQNLTLVYWTVTLSIWGAQHSELGGFVTSPSCTDTWGLYRLPYLYAMKRPFYLLKHIPTSCLSHWTYFAFVISLEVDESEWYCAYPCRLKRLGERPA